MTVIASYIYRLGERTEKLPLTGDPFQETDGEFALDRHCRPDTR